MRNFGTYHVLLSSSGSSLGSHNPGGVADPALHRHSNDMCGSSECEVRQVSANIRGFGGLVPECIVSRCKQPVSLRGRRCITANLNSTQIFEGVVVYQVSLVTKVIHYEIFVPCNRYGYNPKIRNATEVLYESLLIIGLVN